MSSDSPSIVFAADLHHFEGGIWKNRDDIVGDADHALKQIVDFSCEQRAGVLALGGDILDKPRPSPDPLKTIYKCLDQLQAADVQVVFILGQHDGRFSWPDIHPWPVHLQQAIRDKEGKHVKDEFKVLEVDGCSIYGFDYMRPAQFMQRYSEILKPEPGIFLLCHQVWKEFMGNVRQAELAMAELPFAVNLLTGDYHVHTTLSYTALDGSTGTAFSPGSTHIRDVAEEETKQFFAIYCKGESVEYASVELDTRPARRFQITSPHEAEKFLGRLDLLPLDGEGIKRAVIDVAYYDDIEGLGDKLKEALGDRCHLFLRTRNRQREMRAPSAVARRAVADSGLAGSAGLVCEGTVYDSAVRLLSAIDPRVELETMRAEFYATSDAEEPQEVV
jgi:hypothetical protein